MEKNVKIIDRQGNVIGYTYPKRAKGLVRNGRAEPVDENCIMMPDTQVPTVVENTYNTEGIDMSKVIGFEARGFKIDPTCWSKDGVANRTFVTDALGNNVEAYEISEFQGHWTQISYEMPVGKNEDYDFVFAMTGDIDNVPGDVKCNFIVMPIHEKVEVKAITDLSGETGSVTSGSNENAGASKKEEDPGKEDWENRYQYSLINRDYKPTMEKLWNGKSIRFYRIPFNTGDADKVRFVFVAFKRQYKIYPVKNFEEYAKLPDYNPENRNDRFERKFGFGGNCGGNKNGWSFSWNRGNNGPGNGPFGWYSGPKGFNEADKKAAENLFNNIGMMVSNAVKEAMESFEKFQKGNFEEWEKRTARSNKNPYSESDHHKSEAAGNRSSQENEDPGKRNRPGKSRSMDSFVLAQLLSKCEDDGDLDLNGYYIDDTDSESLSKTDIETADDFSLSMNNANMGGDAFCSIMKKIGDNCDVSCNNSIIGTAKDAPGEMGGFGSTSDDGSFSFVNSTLSEAAFAVLLSKIGDGCDVNLSNSEINDFNEIKEIEGCCNSFDNTSINVDNTRISKRMYHMLVRCCGDDSEINGNAIIW